MTSVPEAVRDCARWAAGARPAPDLALLDDEAWTVLVRAARLDRLAGVVAVAAAQSGLDGPRRDHVAEIEAEWVVHTLRAEHAMLAAVGLFDQAGIPHRVLKGSVFAHRYWPAPELRVFADADVLIPSRHLDDAVRLVLASGGERILPQVRRGFDRRFGKSVTLRKADRLEIDLHRQLVAGPHAFIVPEEDLWGEFEPVVVGGRTVSAFPAHIQLVHAAAHLVASVSPRVASLLDVAFTGMVADLDAAADLAARWRMRAMVRSAVLRTEALLGDAAGPVVAWASTLQPTAEEERLHELFVGNRSFRRSARASVPYITRQRDKVRFLASLALPSKAHRQAR